MKSHFLALFLCLFAATASAQFDDNFGIISKKEIALTECAFDMEAPAAILLDEGFSDHDDSYHLTTTIHKRIKILKEKGIEEANVSIFFYKKDGFEFISGIKAVTFNPEANGLMKEHHVEKKSIYLKEINDEVSEISFAFPNVKVGSILEYQFARVMKHYGGLQDWHFQSELPVYKSSYVLTSAPNLEFTYNIQKKADYPIVITPYPQVARIYFEMKELPGLDEEPYMDARKDYVQKVSFQVTKFHGMVGNQKYMTSWNEVARQLHASPDFGGLLKGSLKEAEEKLLPSLSGKTDVEKMEIIHQYVQNNFSWDGGKWIYAEPNLRTLWSKKSGNAASINLALVSLLRSAGLEADPVLVSERGHGKVNTQTPFIKDFSSTYATVLINGRYYYLNGTDKITPAHLIPFSILNSKGVILKSKTGNVVDISEDSIRYGKHLNVSSIVSSDGAITGSVHITSRDYARAETVGQYNRDKQGYADKHIKPGWVNLNIDSFTLSDNTVSTQPLVQDFVYRSAIQTTGDYSFVTINMFTGYESTPFISNDRFSNINLGYKTSVALNHVVHLPAEYTVDAIPKKIKIVSADRAVSLSREVFHEAGSAQVIARIKIDINKSLFNVNEYADLKEFYKRMIDLMNEQVVLKKKS